MSFDIGGMELRFENEKYFLVSLQACFVNWVTMRAGTRPAPTKGKCESCSDWFKSMDYSYFHNQLNTSVFEVLFSYNLTVLVCGV